VPQAILPLIPRGATPVNNVVSVWRDDDRWTYFVGTHPIYYHGANDPRLFRLVTSQLIEAGVCRHCEIQKTFHISKSSVNRALKKLRTGGPEAFFEDRRGRRGGHVLTPEVLEKAQTALDQGHSRRSIAEELQVQPDTLRKAINDGRLREPKPSASARDKSSRTVQDAAAAAGLGTACTRVEERVLAAVGGCDGAPARFEACRDVSHGGVLCALPALMFNGLFEGAEQLLGRIKGYYTTFHVLMLLAFMALCRIKTVERIRSHAPGEFGKLLGLDRIPEVRCLRKKIDELSAGQGSELWAASLSTQWMNAVPQAVGTLYIDGHVRVYHGSLTQLPRRYIARERLCLRATTDYWVNDLQGLPVFAVEKPIDPGLLATLREDIVPRLLQDVPGQPTEEERAEHPHRCRFILVFDRAGYSPAFFREMWKKHRIACMTYHKHPGESWPMERFAEHEVRMPNGEIVTMQLAEMGSLVGSGNDALWMKEVRKLTESGHQTSLISTAFELEHTELGARMFSRWCQENFFKYMLEHFSLDLLCEYGTEAFPDTEKVVNPAWRERNKLRNSLQNKLRYRQARFAEATLHPERESNAAKYQKWVRRKADLLEQVQHYEHQLEELKTKIKQTPKHITWAELEDKDRFHRLLPGRKRLMDTIRMIAYRTETAMAGMLRSATVDSAQARRLLQDLYVTEADILPEPDEAILRVRVHNTSRPAANRALAKLLDQLNETESTYPGTDLRLVYELAGLAG
jgi:transposase